MEGLENLSKYRYTSIDKSILNGLLQPYFRLFLCFIPRWMAPNLVTLLGLVLATVAFALATYYNLILQESFPSWACVASAVLLWLYSTMDNIDGKQARRTGTSSPLGELFDHGCDAIATCMAAWIQVAVMGLGNSYEALMLFLLAFVAFFLSTAEHYHTKTLFLWYISGPTEGLLIACLIMLAAAQWGTELWTVKKLGDFAFLSFILPIPSVLQLSVIRFIICTCILLLLTCVVPWGFWNALCSPNRKVSFPVMLWQGVPFFVFIFVLLQWPFFSGSGILIPGKANFFCFIMSACLVFIRWMPTVVLCNFLHLPFPTYIWTIFPFLVGYLVLKYLPSIAAYYNPTSELVIFSVFAIFLLLNYLQWANYVISKLCQHLRIRCFSISPIQLKKD